MSYFSWLIRLGDYDLQDDSDEFDLVELEMLEVFIHPKFNITKAYFDVAVISIENVKFIDGLIRPICLNFNSEFDKEKYANTAATVTGWGVFNSSAVTSSTLKSASLTIYDYK